MTESTSAITSFDSPLVPPVTVTGAAASVTTTTAELTGTIDALGAQATYHFEYGLTTDYGSRVPTGGDGVAGSERTPRKVSRSIKGLQPGTTYHYRLVANNEMGEAFGEDRTFTTLAADPLARRYEQVTPVDKHGATINANLGFQPAADGSAVSYMLTSAPSDAPSSVLFSHYISRRGSADWLPWSSADPPLNVAQTIVETTTHAISSDFTKAMVVSNRALTPAGPDGPYEGGPNIYIEDLQSKTYTFVGANEQKDYFGLWVSTSREKQFLAGAPDFSWIAFLSPVPLLPGAPQEALYRWSQDEGLTLQSLSSGSVQMPNSAREPSSKWVSDDGTDMYYNLMGGAVYHHELNGLTEPISVVQAGPEAGTAIGGKIDAVSGDGRYAFFRSGQLTTEAQEEAKSGTYMYRYDAETGDLETVGPAIDGETGRLLGAGNDGRTVIYNSGFEDGTTAWRDGVRHRFTTLHPDLNGEGVGFEMFYSPNGRYLTYLNDDGTAHLYDAETQVDVCVSCLPDGSGDRNVRLPAGARFISNRIPAVVLDDGTTFFDTTTRLLAADHNGSRDVYSYRDGVLTLISPGDGPYSARFGDATPDGSSIYFTTDQALVSQDTDKSIDVYDYRLGGGFPGQSPPLPAPECGEGDCQGTAPSAAPGPVVGSMTFSDGPARVSVSGLKTVTGHKASLKVTVPGTGRLEVSGAGLKPSSLNTKKAGSYRVPLRLSQRSRQTLKKKHRLKLQVTVQFTPTDGEPSSARTQVTFKQPQTTRKGASR